MLGDDLFQILRLPPEVLDLASIGCPFGVAREAPLASLEELLRPAVIQALGDAFATAKTKPP